MAEENNDSGQKEFDATEQKLQQARDDGNIAQSKEANALALLIGIVISAYVLNSIVGQNLFNDFSSLLYHGDVFAADAFDSGGTKHWGWFSSDL
jgi:flagellar biosynthetic protein FlhB